MKIAEVSIRRAVLAAVMNAVLLVVGVVAYPGIGVDLFPEVEFPVVTVTTIYPGADPGAIESKVVDVLEEELNTINGIKVLRSVSLENVGQVIIQFRLDRAVDQAAQDVRDKVSGALSKLPPDIEPPIVEKFDVGAAPILSLAIASDRPLREVTQFADDVVKARLQKLNGVGSIDVVGGRDREVHVWLSKEQLASYGLTAGDVATALRIQNLEIPGGRITLEGTEFAVKTKGEVESPAALGNIIIRTIGGAPIRIRDVGRVEDGAAELRSWSDLDGKSAVALVVRKQSGANTVAVAKRVKSEIERIRETSEGYTVAVPTDNSLFIEASINDVQFDLLFGGILTVLIIMFFLRDWRATLISALALPTSVIATFGFISFMGFTFNNMTMLALTLSIGILIDDAIVVIENIHRHLEMGKSPRKAARDATAEIGLAVMAITASILAVFLPVATMEGIIGRFFYQFGMTVSFAVGVSLLVSFTLTPMLSSRFLKLHHGDQNILFRVIERGLVAIDEAYRRTLAVALGNRTLTMVGAVGAFVASIAVLGLVDKEFLPPEDRGEFKVVYELPSGTSLDDSIRFGRDLSTELAEVDGFASLFTTIGGGAQGQVNKGEIHVALVDRHDRAFTTIEAIEYTRAALGERPPAILAVERIGAISGGGFRSSMIQFNIRGQNFDEINDAARGLVAQLEKRGGYVDLDTSFRGGKPELEVNIDRSRAAEVGVPVVVIASTIRTLVAGEEVTELEADGERIDVRVRLEDEQRRAAGDIAGIKVRGARGQLVELSNFVNLERGVGPAQIERQNRQRQVTVLADLEGKPLGDAVSEIEEIAKSVVPASLTTDWAGMGDVMVESFGHMVTALILAVILVYLILAAQFESLIHPITIMLALPLSTIGAFGALAVMGMSLNIFSMIGLIMLMGLVTKNAVLLVDYTNTLRTEHKMSKRDALLAAGPVRLRPILMTTAAMIFGMLPVALGRSLGGETRAPMAVAVIGGLITSTALTLVVVPVVYSLLDRFARRSYVDSDEEAAVIGSDVVGLES